MVHRSLAQVFFVTLGVLFALPSVSFAADALTITKVVADVPGANAGHQYIEVTNAGSEAIDLGAKTVRLVDHSGKHLIKSFGGASSELAPGKTVAIAQNPATFLSDNPSYRGVVLKSSFSLTETGTVQLVQMSAGADATVLATKTYASAPAAKKPSAAKSSSTKQQKVTKTNHEKGIVAPPASANTGAGGAPSGALDGQYGLPLSPAALGYVDALVANGWFALFLGLVAFSAFSVIVIQKQQFPQP